jgi:CrcB protein
MQILFLIAAGGAIGASLRFFAGLAAQKLTGHSTVITGTVFANLAGCFFAGIIIGWMSEYAVESTSGYLFFSVGLLGSLSTFSTFILELLSLSSKKDYPKIAAYLFLQIVVALLFTAFGLFLYKQFSGS